MKPLAALLGLALAGCATVGSPAGGGGWVLQVSGVAGAAITLSDAQGRDTLRVACRRDPADLYVASDLAGPAIGPVTLQVGGRAFPLVPSGEEPRLAATAALPDDLPAALMAEGRIGVRHPGGQLGPYPAIDPQTAAAFAIACRR